VLIVDFDYHHGNGTQDIFGNGVSYISSHASPAYPGTGYEIERHGNDLLANIPLPASGVTTEAFVALWDALMGAVTAKIKPDFIVASAGFDYVAGDAVGDLGVDVVAAASLARAISKAAREHCNGRVAYVLEGGYNMDALTASIAHILRDDAPAGVAEIETLPPAVATQLSNVILSLSKD